MLSYINKIVIILLITHSLEGFTLKEGYKYALKNDIDFNINSNNLKNISYDKDIAISLTKSKIDFSAEISASKDLNSLKKITKRDYTQNDEYQVKLIQPLFDGFESASELNIQNARYKSAVHFMIASKEKIALEYSLAYINVLKEKEILDLNIESFNISKKIFQKVKKKIDSGYGTRLEYVESNGNYLENKVNISVQEINLNEAIEKLRFYVQKDFYVSKLQKPTYNFKLPENISKGLDVAFSHNPSINVAEDNVKVAIYEKNKVRKNFYPTLNLVSTYNINKGLYSTDEDENNFEFGFQLNYNLYSGGKNSAEEKKAIQKIKDKKLLVKQIHNQVENNVRTSWHNYLLYKDKQVVLEEFALIKKDILNANLKEFDLGLKDLNTLLDTHVEYIDVKKNLIRNIYDMLIVKYTIINSLGNLSDMLDD